MIFIQKRFLNGEPVEREDMAGRPVESERIARVIERVRRRERR